MKTRSPSLGYGQYANASERSGSLHDTKPHRGNTESLKKNAFSKLKGQRVKGLILDLRFYEGGIFEAATESIRVFVPRAKRS
ncbi:MAG: hypothetical protein EOP10_14395 [Proteobacteria bacterium]|nr:MAG: hypothetical protein EOP10_14395 [Pseudomonadota bacterium]